MAIGAVFLSCPLALVGAVYLSILHGLNAVEGLAVYGLMGATMLACYALVFSLRLDDLY